jgi:cytochrome P450
MLDVDAPDHTRLRALVHKAFTPRLMEQLRGRAQQITDDLLDAAERKGSFDLVEDFALPLPIVIISDMLGVEAKDRGKFAGWSKQLVSVSSRNEGMRILPSIIAFAGYIKKLIRTRQQDPRDDLLTAMIDAREAGDKLSEEEMMGMILLLLVAGHETTANLIANGTLELLQQPDQWDMMRQQPQMMRTAIEELLRYTGPVEKATERYAKEDTEYHGVPIARGETVLAVLASANRDEAQFPNAATLDVTRDPNRHLAFGMGIHYCLGAPLARMESQIAFTSLVERMPNLRLTTAPDQLRWRRSLFLRGLEALPVKC